MAERLCRALLTVVLLCCLPPTLAAAGGPAPAPAPAPTPAPAPAPAPAPTPGALPPLPPAGGGATTATTAAPQCAASYGPCRSAPDTAPPPCYDGDGWRCKTSESRRLQSANADSAIDIPTKCCDEADVCAARSFDGAEAELVCMPAQVWHAEGDGEYDYADYAESPTAKAPAAEQG
jgi:hypothetical protein